MVTATAAASAFLAISGSTDSLGKTSGKISGNLPSSVDPRGAINKSNSTSSRRLSVKSNVQAPFRIYRTKSDDENYSVSTSPQTFINLLPDWSKLLAAITTTVLAAENQWKTHDCKPKRADMVFDPFGFGRIMQGVVFRQNFNIRSYEVGADMTASIETVLNHLQETAINHVKTVGLMANGFGSTVEMVKRNLIWVVSKMQVVVDRYPRWNDVVQIDTWIAAAGKNGMRRDWLIHDCNTGETLLRATSVCVMMDKETRKLSKFPDEVRDEIGGYFVDSPPVVEDFDQKLPKFDDKTADYIRDGLTAQWSDLDLNQHVNNVKYIRWILESASSSIVEDHELAAVTLEYRRECKMDSVVQSLASVLDKGEGEIECRHLLRLDGGGDVVKGRTGWRRKFGSAGKVTD